MPLPDMSALGGDVGSLKPANLPSSVGITYGPNAVGGPAMMPTAGGAGQIGFYGSQPYIQGTPNSLILNAGPLIFWADNTYDIGAAGASRPRNIYAANWVVAATGSFLGVNFGNGTVTSGNQMLGGTGAPAAGMGNNGDYYFRTDTPGTANQRLYVKSGGAWTGIV